MEQTILDELLNRVKVLEKENDSLKQKIAVAEEKLSKETVEENAEQIDSIEEFLNSNEENSK